MKKYFHLLFILIFFPCAFLFSQTGLWTWMHGSASDNPPGNFGVRGIAAPANDPPATFQPAFWTDNNGNFWILGGENQAGIETALWKYNPQTNMWAWMKGPSAFQQAGIYGTRGIANASNFPGARANGSCTWTDAQNNLWLFGGYGYDKNGSLGNLDDLWLYNSTTNEWTWMNGSDSVNAPGSYGSLQVASPSNNPPARTGNCAWTDNNGNFWMYSGKDANGNNYSDLWYYNTTTHNWTWMNGSQQMNQLAVFGTKGVADSSNTPGGTAPLTHWKDSFGKFWLFGGIIHSSSQSYASLWNYDPDENTWKWVAGTDIPNDTITFSAKCLSGTIHPKPREGNAGLWVDDCGHFWNFGGNYFPLPDSAALLNDLWVYDPGTNLFTLTGGTTIENQHSVYGTILVPSATNMPGAIFGNSVFKDTLGNFWSFGGNESSNGLRLKNTMWKYVPDTGCVKFTPDTLIQHDENICLGNSVNFSIPLFGTFDYYWNFGDQRNPNAISTDEAPTYTYSSSGTYHVTLYFRPQFPECQVYEISKTTVTIQPDVIQIIFPNVFTPNADNVNDIFPGISDSFTSYHLYIFNRWGQLVFETQDVNENWDGKFKGNEAEDGVYYWTAEMKGCSDKTNQAHGFVHLIR